MACPKYPGMCEDCYFFNREPTICDECEEGSNYEPAELDHDSLDELREIQDLIAA